MKYTCSNIIYDNGSQIILDISEEPLILTENHLCGKDPIKTWPFYKNFEVQPHKNPVKTYAIEDYECHIRPDLTVEMVREACVSARNARIERFAELGK